MSRIRTVKPELFKHEDLFDAEQKSGLPLRLAFIGLFTVADCEGRFKWRPRTLKLDVLPHDFIDFATVLNALENAGFIERYEVDGEIYGWIPSFTKHQRLQTKEITAGSSLPAPCLQDQQGTHQERSQVRTGTHPESQEGKGKEGKGREEEGSIPSSPSAPSPPSARSTRTPKTPLPADLAITPELRTWAEQHGYGDLEAHLEHFRDKATANGYRYADWRAALRNAIRDDWAGLRKLPATATTRTTATGLHDPPAGSLSKAGEQQRQNLALWLQQSHPEPVHELH